MRDISPCSRQKLAGLLRVLLCCHHSAFHTACFHQELAASLHGGMLAALELRPGAFPVYLQREAGFRLVRQLQKPSVNKGFDRPMYLLEKLAE